jgi:DNA replication and repair protein RecF
MLLQSLSIKRFRNIESADLEFSPGLNIISGCNAAGKTSFLETIYFLGRANSFRTHKPSELIQREANSFELFARTSGNQTSEIPVGVGYGKQGLDVRIQGESVKRLSDLAAMFPLQLLAGNIHQLLEDGPRFRRRFMDWGLFHVEPSYAFEWRRYQRALKQRNAALRSKAAPNQISVWNEDLIKSCQLINKLRSQFIDNITIKFNELFSYLVEEEHFITVKYHSGIPAGKEYEACLAEQLEKDREQGYTQYGIHRGDFMFQEKGKDLMLKLSRGQQKLLVIALQLCQPLTDVNSKIRGLYLLDDLGSELDHLHQKRAIECLSGLNIQAFITAIQPEVALKECKNASFKLFHVEHGNIKEVV